MGAMQPGQVIGYFIGIIAIIFAAYYVTYYVGKRASGQSMGRLRNKNINVIDRFSISRDKSFCLVEIAGKVYVVGVTNQSMTLLDTLDAAAFSEAAAMKNPESNFSAAPGSKYTSAITNKMAEFIAKKTGQTMPETDVTSEKFSESMKNAQAKNDNAEE